MKITTPHHSLVGLASKNILSNCLALTKFRLLGLVLVSTGLGYYLATPGTGNLLTLTAILLGVALVGAGANSLNQWYERDADALMERTKQRPLPSGKLSAKNALWFGLSISLTGLILIALLVNIYTATLSFISWASYLFIYTPLKRRSVLNTWAGAVSGALPAVLGWTAVTGNLSWGALSLFSILYFWQLPHFFAIAWVHKDDYKRGGFKMLSGNDDSGKACSLQIVLNCICLIIASSGLFFTTESGVIYLYSSLVLGAIFVRYTVHFYLERSIINARKVFLFSIIYLPILFLVIVIDRLAV